MEADSTTNESSASYLNNSNLKNISFPFSTSPRNIALYEELLTKNGEKSLECQIVERLQDFGLIPRSIKCPEDKPDCNVVCKPARVVDRMQWVCEGCKKRQPIRVGSFFYKLQCSILQVMQMIFSWCEDAEINEAAEFFDVKSRTASIIYEKLDELVSRQLYQTSLGGEGAVVLTEMYPDCLNRQSPDTTEQAHVHQILMIADSKHIPTNYRLHVMRSNLKKMPFCDTLQLMQSEVEEVLSNVTASDSLVVSGNSVPLVDASVSLAQLLQHSDVEMQHFLSNRVWRQALVLCGASRDVCASAAPAPAPATCAGTVQRYLDTALYRLRHGQDLYRHTLTLLTAHTHNDDTH